MGIGVCFKYGGTFLELLSQIPDNYVVFVGECNQEMPENEFTNYKEFNCRGGMIRLKGSKLVFSIKNNDDKKYNKRW